MNIQKRATEQYMYVPTVLFIKLYKVALTFASADYCVIIQIKAIEQFVPVVMSIIL